MTYICSHGFLKADCATCVAFEEGLSEFDWDILEADESANEYLYDYYLDLDEKALRESEEN